MKGNLYIYFCTLLIHWGGLIYDVHWIKTYWLFFSAFFFVALLATSTFFLLLYFGILEPPESGVKQHDEPKTNNNKNDLLKYDKTSTKKNEKNGKNLK